jgi:hypothetical protein
MRRSLHLLLLLILVPASPVRAEVYQYAVAAKAVGGKELFQK